MAESVIDRIVTRNQALWVLLDETQPRDVRLAALDVAFRVPTDPIPSTSQDTQS